MGVVNFVVRCAAGHIVFHGPREDVVEFFESCGFQCPERKGIPDFLQEVTSVNDQKVSLLSKPSWCMQLALADHLQLTE